MNKPYFEYKFKKWEAAHDGIIALSQFRNLIEKKDRERGGDLWDTVDSINKYIADTENDRTRQTDPQWLLEKNCISLYNLELSRKLLAGLTKNQIAPGENLDAIYDELLGELHLIKVITDGTNIDLMPYSAEELTNILAGKVSGHDIERLIRTLIETVLDKDGHDNGLTITTFLGKEGIARLEEMEMHDVLVFSLMLNFLYRRFTVLKSFQQRFLLQLNFYKAITMGVPVRQYVREELLRFVLQDNVIGFTESNRILYEWLKLSEEMIVGSGGKKIKIKDVYSTAIAKAGAGEGELDKYIGDLYKDKPESQFFIEWLKEACSIVIGLKEATLVDWDKEKEKFVQPYELNQRDLEQMMISFGYGKNFEFIVDYYKKKETLVSFRQFIDALKNVADLTNENDVENIIKLTNELHNNNIISEEQDIIEFDEQKGTFFWIE